MNFLTREQVYSLDHAECTDQLKLLTSTYALDKPITEIWEQVWDDLDSITNMILYLEDRISQLELSETLSKANAIRWNKEKESP